MVWFGLQLQCYTHTCTIGDFSCKLLTTERCWFCPFRIEQILCHYVGFASSLNAPKVSIPIKWLINTVLHKHRLSFIHCVPTEMPTINLHMTSSMPCCYHSYSNTQNCNLHSSVTYSKKLTLHWCLSILFALFNNTKHYTTCRCYFTVFCCAHFVK